MLLETFSYAIFLVLLILSTWLLFQRRKFLLRRKMKEPVRLQSMMFYLVAGFLMFLAITAKWILWWPEVLPIPEGQGIVTQVPGLSRSVYRAKEVLLQITVILGDLVTVYRLWIISSRDKITVVFPIMGLIGFLVCIIMLSGPLNDTVNTPILIVEGKLRMKPWDLGAVTATVSITVYITLMIGWIILKARIRIGVKALGHSFTQALSIVVESAAIYTIWNLMLIISGAAFRSPVALCFLDSVPAIYGISVTLINVRVGLGWARGDERVAGPFRSLKPGMGHSRWLSARVLGASAYYQIDPYDLISILLESLSYGIFLVLFILSTALLFQRRRAFLREEGSEPVKLRSLLFYLVTGVMMFFSITANWAFWWAEVLPIHARGPGVVAHIPRLSTTAYRLEQVFLKITVILGDSITIYRLWILSNGNKTMIIFPVVGLLGFVACAISLSGPANEGLTRLIPIIDGKLKLTPWDIAATACTVSITVYVTVMITWIIAKARLYVGAKALEGGVKQALVLIVESAAIYTLWNLLFFIAGLGFENEIADSLLHCMPAVSGISVMLINSQQRQKERSILIGPKGHSHQDGGSHRFLEWPSARNYYYRVTGRYRARGCKELNVIRNS
ncbi:hypothetical protein NP233_g264 [Leucocoprinus birnbaumii]|uniref:Uncharacterized protein n=1 Tax=Leucocoprinus birnbaumii TaxID=56174 RepID=A0AAD5W4I2_9AGAR|nr:hypothetical protein NP233_g264 [Leucocoprinus birnbaumii]